MADLRRISLLLLLTLTCFEGSLSRNDLPCRRLPAPPRSEAAATIPILGFAQACRLHRLARAGNSASARGAPLVCASTTSSRRGDSAAWSRPPSASSSSLRQRPRDSRNQGARLPRMGMDSASSSGGGEGMVQSPGGEGGGGVCDAAARRYWDGMNRRDIDYALEQFSDEIFFQDMMFPDAFVGKEKLRSHFKACLDGFPEGLVFVIDEISVDAGDGKCGAYWHCETPEGKAFPFSRGLSFYKCDGNGKLVFAREIPEPSTKPGGAGLALAKFGSFMMQFIPESVTFPKGVANKRGFRKAASLRGASERQLLFRARSKLGL